MQRISLLAALVLLGLGAPASALAGTPCSSRLAPIRFDTPESEVEGEEAEEAQEGEAGEGSEEQGPADEAEEEAEEEDRVGGASKRHHDAKRRHASVQLTSLELTPGGLTALRHGHARTASVCFSFTLTATTKVRVVLATQSRGAGHVGWHTLRHVALSGKRGSNLAHLSGNTALAAGYDRLTLTPTHGARRTIAFRVE